MSSVYCIAKSEAQLDSILDRLRRNGFSAYDVSILFPDREGKRDFAVANSTKAPEGATVGAASGAVLGGALGWLVGVGSLAIPGLGPLIAAGPILAALSGVAAGGALGGISGGLIGLGVPEYEAKLYEGKLRSGNILISVHVEHPDRAEEVRRIFTEENAADISSGTEARVS